MPVREDTAELRVQIKLRGDDIGMDDAAVADDGGRRVIAGCFDTEDGCHGGDIVALKLRGTEMYNGVSYSALARRCLMYKSFRVKNFRCFKDLQINDLGRVNLIAGKNNTGKTALMEAIHIHSGIAIPRRY